MQFDEEGNLSMDNQETGTVKEKMFRGRKGCSPNRKQKERF